MYDKLVKRLRLCAEGFRCRECDYGNVRLCRWKMNNEAADAIEELMRRCEQFQYMPPPAWIPVTERLPRMWEEVMLRFPNNQAVGFHDGDSGWAVFSGDNMYTYVAPEEVHPTHWKPKEE